MKETKFIELLNLYVDHQISPTDAALLEAETQRHPDRRRIYREYCQMQKACSVLAENFRSDAPSDGKLVDMPSPSGRLTFVTYAMGFAAAAACVALVVVNRPSMHQRAVSAPIAASDAPGASQLDSSELAVTQTKREAARTVLQPVFAAGAPREAVVSTALATSDSGRLDWMNQVQLQPVTADALRFDSHPALQTRDLTLRSAQTYQGQLETTAFIFAK